LYHFKEKITFIKRNEICIGGSYSTAEDLSLVGCDVVLLVN